MIEIKHTLHSDDPNGCLVCVTIMAAMKKPLVAKKSSASVIAALETVLVGSVKEIDESDEDEVTPLEEHCGEADCESCDEKYGSAKSEDGYTLCGAKCEDHGKDCANYKEMGHVHPGGHNSACCLWDGNWRPRLVKQSVAEPTNTVFVDKPQTQKARGIRLTRYYGVPTSCVLNAKRVTEVSLEGYSESSKLGSLPAFARPCPMRPRPGFVESRMVNNWPEIVSLAHETVVEDPDGEIVLVPRIDNCVASAVVTEGMITIGQGNDGATSGRDSTTLFIAPHGEHIFDSIKLKEAGILENAHYELVITEGFAAYIVQLRDGPRVEQQLDYVPEETVVKSVVKAEGSLLEWERRFNERDLTASGVVIWHPGGSIGSHYGLHAIQHGVPVVTTHEPQVGDVLSCAKTVMPLSAQDVLRGIAIVDQYAGDCSKPFNENIGQLACRLVVTTLHNSPYLRNTKEGQVIIGMALNCALRLSLMAVAGEHRNRRVSERNGTARSLIYAAAWAQPMIVRRRLYRLHKAYMAGRWRKGYGGKPWAECTEATVRLMNAVQQFIRLNGQQQLDEAMLALNHLVTTAHNNGFFLSKFMSSNEFNYAASFNEKWFLTKASSSLAWAIELIKSASEDVVIDSAWRKMRRLGVPHVSKQTVAKPAVGEAEPPAVESVQYHAQGIIRDEVLHVQWTPSTSPERKYNVCNIPLPIPQDEAEEWLRYYPKTKSHASEKMYYKLSMNGPNDLFAFGEFFNPNDY